MKKIIYYGISIFLLAVVVLELGKSLRISCGIRDFKELDKKELSEDFRAMRLSEKIFQEGLGEERYERAAEELFWSELRENSLATGKEKGFLTLVKRQRLKSVPQEEWNWYIEQYKKVLKDIKCFPVGEDTTGKYGWSYEDSWGNPRSYGGKRRHEGTDIMAENNERGYFSVVSVSDGRVEKKGWLEQGGYRIGIRSPQGGYYYYAHLYDYASLEEGDQVKAGDFLGHMGDTGYSKIEGTTGNFPVHLHFGIYLDINGEETSVNPYYILRHIETWKSYKKDTE